MTPAPTTTMFFRLGLGEGLDFLFDNFLWLKEFYRCAATINPVNPVRSNWKPVW